MSLLEGFLHPVLSTAPGESGKSNALRLEESNKDCETFEKKVDHFFSLWARGPRTSYMTQNSLQIPGKKRNKL